MQNYQNFLNFVVKKNMKGKIMESTLILKPKGDERIKFGHLWIYSNELAELPKLPAGSIVRVADSKGRDYGFGFYNPNSLISVRLLKTYSLPDLAFLIERITKAKELREKLFGEPEMCRLVFGESDFLPGLIIDKYSDYFSLQILSAGFEAMREQVVTALITVFPNTKGIIEKDNSMHRELEGLTETSGVIWGEVPDYIYTSERGVKLRISLPTAQKTGYFLDQRNNRYFIRTISKGLSYTNQGGFALNASLGGASKIAAIDCSETALDAVRENAKLNNAEIETINADVSDYLTNAVAKGDKWDMIILDPPAFTKSRKSVPKAKAAYGKINRLAMKMLNKGGFLVSSSCSHHIFEDVFTETIYREACKQGLHLKQIFRGTQSPDHPILLGLPETQYLKFFVFQIE